MLHWTYVIHHMKQSILKNIVVHIKKFEYCDFSLLFQKVNI